MRRLPPLLVPGAALVAAALSACAEDRERLDPPRVRVEVEERVVAPGDTVRGRVTGVDRTGGIVRLAVRLCIDSGFQTLRINPDRPESTSFDFRIRIPVQTPQNALVIVEGQVNDAQNFYVTTQDTIVARDAGVPSEPPARQPSCARPGGATR